MPFKHPFQPKPFYYSTRSPMAMNFWVVGADPLSWHQVPQDLSGKGRGNPHPRGISSSLTPPFSLALSCVQQVHKQDTQARDWQDGFPPAVGHVQPNHNNPRDPTATKSRWFLPSAPPVPAGPSSRSFPWQPYCSKSFLQHRYLLLTPHPPHKTSRPFKPQSSSSPKTKIAPLPLHPNICPPALCTASRAEEFPREPQRILSLCAPQHLQRRLSFRITLAEGDP